MSAFQLSRFELVTTTIVWIALVVLLGIQSATIHRQSQTIKELTTVCERLSQVFEEAEEGTATAIEQEQQPEGITDL